jgi:MFS family permease
MSRMSAATSRPPAPGGESPGQRALYRRTLAVVVVSQIFGGAGLAVGVTVGALLAREMLGTDEFAGLPTALFTLGSAGAALGVGRLTQRLGRRDGLTAGFLGGALGAMGVVLAARTGSIPLLFVSLFFYGAGSATNLQARYAGTDLATNRQRGTAVSIALVSTTLGAVTGPNLVVVTGRLARGLGVSELAGPFLLAATAYLLAGAILLLFLRPDPLLIARTLVPGDAAPDLDTRSLAARRGIWVGATVMVLTQLAMVAIMTMTPVQMRLHGHGLADVGIVIGVHIAAMYLPSLGTGMLVDRVGRIPVAVAGGVMLLAAGLTGALAPPDSMPVLTTALILLGAGWNFGLISGTALIIDATAPATRAKTQGAVDVLIAMSGATGGALSGLVVAASSYATLSLSGGVLALLLIPVVLWARHGPARPSSPRTGTPHV